MAERTAVNREVVGSSPTSRASQAKSLDNKKNLGARHTKCVYAIFGITAKNCANKQKNVCKIPSNVI